jgi:tRNA modification GTPase
LAIERGGRKAELMLVDIGGLDEPAAALDEAVQRTARDAIARAELLLEIDDGSGVGRGEPARAAASRGTPRLKVRGKADRSTDPAADVNVSAVTGEGLEVLRAVLAERLADRAVTIGGGMLALQPRHRQAIEAALDSIREALSRVEPMREAGDLAEPEIVAETMRQALDRLGEVGGRMTPDEVIGRVFSTFCIGK